MLHECRGLHSGVSTPITGELGCGRARHERLWAQRCARSDAAHCTTLSHEVWQPGVYVHATRQSMICNTHDSRCILVKPKGARPRKRTKPNKKKTTSVLTVSCTHSIPFPRAGHGLVTRETWFFSATFPSRALILAEEKCILPLLSTAWGSRSSSAGSFLTA